MSVSVFELFSIGIGPSSSHTVGPMRAANLFLAECSKRSLWEKIQRVKADLYGSLALTGKGHGTDKAVLAGLAGGKPETIDPDTIAELLNDIRKNQRIVLNATHLIAFNEATDLIFHYDQFLEKHANALTFTAFDQAGNMLHTHTFYSIGGGFVLDDINFEQDSLDQTPEVVVPYPFKTAAELMAHCETLGSDIAGVIMENEKTWRSETQIRESLLHIWHVMDQCIDAGCHHPGILPGGLKVKRRAAEQLNKLTDPNTPEIIREDRMNWVNLYALAVNEENAAGGRVVTAPTNGAAGIIPAVLKFYTRFDSNPSEDGIITYLLTAGAIGILFKLGASISAAEVGCQGEVGVACSMAAAGLCAAWGGTVAQVENAAEIGMEHHLGLTCDPIGGLVQVPCIERNAIGSVTAINSAKLAYMGDGTHYVSLDQVIKTMRNTGKDMQSKYKETAQGGLAVSVDKPAC
jgi:L-serine dehydratase